jgi:DNA polymerase III delta prime subunit
MYTKLYVEKYRPKTLTDMVLSDSEREYFIALQQQDEIPNLLFSGPPGTGKTSLAKIIVNDVLKCQYLYINASDENGIDTIRTKVINFAQTKSLDGKLKVVLLDEADSISLEGSKALRSVMEEYSSNTRFIFTCNYLFKIIPALQSRCQIFQFTLPLDKVVSRIVEILRSENISVPDSEKPLLLDFVRKNHPDMRRIINDIQKFSYTGVLKIHKNTSTKFIKKLYSLLFEQPAKNIAEIRKFVIENEWEFSSDYHALLKELFEEIYKNELIQDKSNTLLLTSEAMYKDSFVLDKEINFLSYCLKVISRSSV